MITTAYPDALRKLRKELGAYREGTLSLPDLQVAAWFAAEAVDSYEERELRKFLQWAEGKLDMIRFTTNSADVAAAALEIVGLMETRLDEALGEHS